MVRYRGIPVLGRLSAQTRLRRNWSGFRTPEVLGEPHADAAGVGKAPRHEIAVGWAPSGAAGSMGIWTRGRRACSLIVPSGRRAEG